MSVDSGLTKAEVNPNRLVKLILFFYYTKKYNKKVLTILQNFSIYFFINLFYNDYH